MHRCFNVSLPLLLAVSFAPTASGDIVINERLAAFCFSTYAPFAILQSRCHEIWARFFSSTLKDDLQYAPSDCFETYPFPLETDAGATLGEIGEAYYQFRSRLMIGNSEGLTATYNRFHDPGHFVLIDRGIKGPAGLDEHRGLHLAEPVTARDPKVNLFREFPSQELSFGDPNEVVRPAGLPAGSRRDHNGGDVRIHIVPQAFLKDLKSLDRSELFHDV